MPECRDNDIAAIKPSNQSFNIKIGSFVGYLRRIWIGLLEGLEILGFEFLCVGTLARRSAISSLSQRLSVLS